jgi:hypothetical protein
VLLWCGLGALARPAIPMFTALPLTTTRPHIHRYIVGFVVI